MLLLLLLEQLIFPLTFDPLSFIAFRVKILFILTATTVVDDAVDEDSTGFDDVDAVDETSTVVDKTFAVAVEEHSPD